MSPRSPKPLAGRTILVTRPADQSASLVKLLDQRGAHTIVAPAIEVRPIRSAALTTALRNLADGDFSWITITSRATLEMLASRLDSPADVRAKVAAIKRAQSAADGHEAERYLATAIDLAAPKAPLLVITHGLSGSGKTTVTDELVSSLPAVRARSDLERKRLHGLAPTARSGSGLGTGLYAAVASQKTYAALAEIADALLRNGQNALIDAAFLSRRDRLRFRQVAAFNAARFAILDCTASTAELRRRIAARSSKGRDASEADLAVLERQLSLAEPFDRAERRHVVTVDTERDIRYAKLAARLRRV